jgi:outer membrane protein assembly complex protein YaeT
VVLVLLMVVSVVVTARASTTLPVASITVLGDRAEDRAAIIEVLGLEVGEPIDRRQLRDAILAVYAGGDVERVRVEAVEVAESLDVTVTASFRSRIAKIEVSARSPLTKNQVKRWMELAPGDPVSFSRIEAGRRRAIRKFRERGYADPQIEVYVDYRRESNTVVLTVDPQPGEVETIGGIELVGIDDPETRDAVMPTVKPNTRLSKRVEERLRRQVEERLRRLGRWDARITSIDRTVDTGPRILMMTIDSGPLYRLEIDAPPEQVELVRNAFPDPVEEDINPAQTATLAERIRVNLQQRGYLLADVAVELGIEATETVVRVRADPESARRIGAVEFPGAFSTDREQLQRAVRVERGPTTGWRGRPVTETTLRADRRLVEQKYRSLGFVDVQVGDPIIEPFEDEQVRILFPVEEGKRWTVDEVRVDGLPVEAAARLEKVDFALQRSDPWNPEAVKIAQRQLQLALADSGYPEGRVASEVDTSEPGVARVVFTVEPGNSAVIGEIVIAGLRKTRPSVVKRMLRAAGVETGEPFARYRLLDAQRRLYELGLFRTVDLVAMPGQERRPVRGLVVNCEEGAQRSYLVGVGWNQFDRFRLTLGWSHLNLFGGGHAFNVEGRISRAEERIQLGIREPRIPKLDVPGQLVIFRTFERVANFTYDQRRRGVWVDVGDRRKVPFRTWYRFEYQNVESDAPPNILPRELQEAKIASITPTLEWDFRDDPLVPTRGTLSELSLEWAFPLFDADSEFLKFWGRSTIYGTLPHGTWSAGIRLGAIFPFETIRSEFENRQVPLNTRYFAGGANTHRGFGRDQLGIPVQTIDLNGNPIGGNALVLINVDYTRPIWGALAGVVFLDVGNVWAEPSLVRLEDFRWASGLGLWFNTPAGPLRAEYGWKLDRKPEESVGEFFLSFGIPF